MGNPFAADARCRKLERQRTQLLVALSEIAGLCDTVLREQPAAGAYAHNMAACLGAKARAAIASAGGRTSSAPAKDKEGN